MDFCDTQWEPAFHCLPCKCTRHWVSSGQHCFWHLCVFSWCQFLGFSTSLERAFGRGVLTVSDWAEVGMYMDLCHLSSSFMIVMSCIDAHWQLAAIVSIAALKPGEQQSLSWRRSDCNTINIEQVPRKVSRVFVRRELHPCCHRCPCEFVIYVARLGRSRLVR